MVSNDHGITDQLMAAAGIMISTKMQGRKFLGDDYEERTAIFAARDRCDETVDRIRCVRSARYKYIRNYLHHRPMLQPNAYKDAKASGTYDKVLLFTERKIKHYGMNNHKKYFAEKTET